MFWELGCNSKVTQGDDGMRLVSIPQAFVIFSWRGWRERESILLVGMAWVW